MARKTDIAWSQIFEAKAYNLEDDLHLISADEIKAITGSEPRLLAKMDRLTDLPQVLRENGYILLPTGRGYYTIIRSDRAFHALEPVGSVRSFEPRTEFPLITLSRNSSEMQFLDYAHATGLLESLLERGRLYATIRGRESSGTFTFNISDKSIEVDRAQIEVDLGLEGKDCIVLIEAKVGHPPEFNTRQLYYPYRRFLEVSELRIEVIPVFFVYDLVNNKYHFWVYEFSDVNVYDSLRLVRQVSYGMTEAPGFVIPPQADSIERLTEFLIAIDAGINRADSMAEYLGFDVRQSNYYQQAAEQLGLVEKFALTDTGKQFVGASVAERNNILVGLLKQYTLINLMLQHLEHTGSLSRADIEMVVARNSEINGSTISRRAQTLIAWLRWIGEQTGDIEYRDNVFAKR